MPDKPESTELQNLPLFKILPNPHQPRKNFDPEALRELTASIKADGLIQPIIVRSAKSEAGSLKYILIAGERRLKACKSLGWKTIPTRILDATEDQARVMSIVENLQREDLNPIEEAEAYQTLVGLKWTQTEIAKEVGKSQGWIARYLGLLKLPGPALKIIRRRIISAEHGVQIGRLPTEALQLEVIREVSRERMTTRETEERVNELLGKGGEESGKSRGKTASSRPSPGSLPVDPLKSLWPIASKEGAVTVQYKGEGNWIADFRTGFEGEKTVEAREALLALAEVFVECLRSGQTAASVQKDLNAQIDQAFKKAGGLKKLEKEAAKFEAEHDMNHIAEGMISKVFDQIPKKDRGAITKILKAAQKGK